MGEPRIWFDPPAFSWGRVLRIGALWFALVVVLMVLWMAVDDERPVPRPVEATGFVAQPPSSTMPVAQVASSPRVASAAR